MDAEGDTWLKIDELTLLVSLYDWTRNEWMLKETPLQVSNEKGQGKLMLKEALGLKGRNGCCRCPM
jgi:hypothetical protein